MAALSHLLARGSLLHGKQQKLSSGGEPFEQQRLSPGGELLFFACAKKSNQKKAHPAFAPATRVRSADGIFGRGILPRPKTAHIPVRRPPAGGFARQLRRCGGDPVDQEQNNSKNNGNGNGNGKSDSCGHEGVVLGAGRAVHVVVRGLAGPSSAASRSRCAIGAGPSFVMSAGVSG
ncbi:MULTISPECIES: hypothetical protein [Xanthomonas]|uniref:hypothetical protein n=1 Tax=Xanthomonas TaxID=338 RepID=UPI001AD96DA2|nr:MULTISPECIES: hypothetical protein [unclassified Xanthomonas]MBO9871994.1 hypothetical protein [Xanthomonas sp. D-93]WNH43101.1 hypothetical protein PG878_11110 [Xanthomonas sp. A6251]